MATIVTRAGKGSPLTHNEVDANFTNLNSDKIESGDTVASLTLTAVDVADKITHTGDTDTSIRFPAADTVTVETAGSERVRVDSGGNVGIGTSNPTGLLELTANTGSGTLNLVSTANASDAGNKIAFFAANRSTTDEEMAYIKPLLVTNNGGAGNVQSGRLTFGTSGSERIRITESGNVGIGTSSPSEALEVDGTVKATAFEGDGSALTGVATVEGSAKAWINFNGTGTIAARDSFNVSSLTDNGTGDYTVNFSNAFSGVGYSNGGFARRTVATALLYIGQANAQGQTTGSFSFTTAASATNIEDADNCSITSHGDLA